MSEATFTFADGTLLERVHPESACAGRGCPLHHPSAHRMVDWPMRWNPTTRAIERECEHGRWHPDPDDLAYKRSVDSFEGAMLRRFTLREAVASVSLSHPETCDCDTCKAGRGDEVAMRRVLQQFGEPPGAHDCDGCCSV